MRRIEVTNQSEIDAIGDLSDVVLVIKDYKGDVNVSGKSLIGINASDATIGGDI